MANLPQFVVSPRRYGRVVKHPKDAKMTISTAVFCAHMDDSAEDWTLEPLVNRQEVRVK